MSIKDIRLFGDPVLRTPARRGRRLRQGAAQLVEDLTDTMLDAPGAGLAAPQIGVGLRVFTYYVDGELGHLVNPEPRPLRRRSRTARRAACRSPAWPSTPRARCAWSPRASTCTASRSTIEGTELLARCVQHETDHLDGILFVDRLDREASASWR